ncbi:hypothetical protein NRIC_26370 [Enterococcus florum]|uniref:Uncharacterized protein n=1 Tax=Enterococcus florum TaxID=2480627 RepID=A0A4P5PAQ9_9ENTE|nr:hypothetical protein NRIC_26370 [Enterococcus florum]
MQPIFQRTLNGVSILSTEEKHDAISINDSETDKQRNLLE